MRKRTYTVIATPSEGWWALEVPEVPGAISQGRTHEEVVFMATDVLSLILDQPAEQIEVIIEYRGELEQSRAK